jgi:hypothetical protein
VEITKTWTAIRSDRALTSAHGGAVLACAPSAAFETKQAVNGAPMTSFVPAYVVDQGSHPPRGPVV